MKIFGAVCKLHTELYESCSFRKCCERADVIPSEASNGIQSVTL